jgi:hypothetical protein
MEKNSRLWMALTALPGAYIVYSLFTYSLLGRAGGSAFPMLGLARIPAFYDIRWLLSFSACGGDIQKLLSSNARCLGFDNPLYPPLSMELGRWLGMTPTDARWIGPLLGIAVIAALAHTCWLCTANLRSWSIITCLLWTAFPTQILLERGNIDGILFLLLSLFCVAAWLPGAASILLANSVNIFAISLKFYPWIGSIGWLIYSIKAPMPPGHKRILNASIIISTVAFSLHTASLMQVANLASSGGLGSHGLAAIGYLNPLVINTLGFEAGRTAIYMLIGLKALFVVGGLLSGLIFGHGLRPPQEMGGLTPGSLADRYSTTFVMVSTCVGLGCYIFSIGYDYRLTFLLPLITLILSNRLDNITLSSNTKRLLNLTIGAFILVFFLPLFSFFQPGILTSLELIDEILAAPFLFSCLGAIWINLFWSFSTTPLPPLPGTSALAATDFRHLQ